MEFNSEEVKIIEGERKRIFNEILEDLKKSLRELFNETSEKEEGKRRIEELEEEVIK